MPKTFTDDIAPVLPSALNGPFQVIKPGDSASYFKLDPASGKVEAAGTARPIRRLTVPLVRTSGVVSNSTIDSGMDARSVGASLDGGFYVAPFVVPPEMDLSVASSVKVVTAPAADGGGATVVRFELTTAYAKDGDTSVVTETLIDDWTTPTGWSTQDLKLVTLDGGSGATYAANKFEASDIIGLLLRRVGSASQDTFPNSLLIGTCVVFEYTAKTL